MEEPEDYGTPESKDSWEPVARIPTVDAPGAAADTSGVGPSYTRTTSESPPTVPNRTIIGLKLGENEARKIPPASLASNKHYEPIYPNYQRLQRLNNGMRTLLWERKENLHPDDDWRLAHALMCQLDMTEYQKRRFQYLFWRESGRGEGVQLPPGPLFRRT